jgi:hypothetical protein
MLSILAGQTVHAAGLTVTTQYNPKELAVEQAAASEPCSTLRSTSGFGTHDPLQHIGAAATGFMDYTDDDCAVYPHNQSDLEFLVARPPQPMSFELMFDGVSHPCHTADGRDAGTARAIKGSTVNINLVAPAGWMEAKWEGPDFDACVRRRG